MTPEERAAPGPYQPGSEADFERLYRNTYRRILGTLITLVRDRATAEDCAQETYERAFRHWRSWRPEASVEAWLHRIATNTCLTALEGRARRPLPTGLGGPAQAPEEPLIGTDGEPAAPTSQRLRSYLEI